MTEVEKCRIIYQGSKLFWRTRNTIDVTIVEHCDCDVTEVIAYEPSINVEAERIYLNPSILRTKLDQVEIDSKFSFAKQNNVPISTEFTDSVMNHAITDFIIPRLIISNFKREECLFVVNLQFRSSDGDNIDDLVRAKEAALHPFATKNHKLLAPGEVDAALKALEEEKCGLDAACTEAAVLEAETHAQLSSKERWRIPIVLIKMDKGKVLSAGDTKIWEHVSRSLKTQADIKRATEVTVQTATSRVQQEARRTAVKPLNSFRQVLDVLKSHRLYLTRVIGAGVGAGVGIQTKPRDSSSRERTELSARRHPSPRNSGRIAASAGVSTDAKPRDSRSREKTELSGHRNPSPRNSGRIVASAKPRDSSSREKTELSGRRHPSPRNSGRIAASAKPRDSSSREKTELSGRRNPSPRNSGRIAASAGAGADAKPRDSRSREKTELSGRRHPSPQNSGRIVAISSRLLAGTATSQARAQCAAEDSHPTPKTSHKKMMKRAGSRNGHANNTSKRSLRMSANSESRDNSDTAGDLCASPDADHSGILDCSSPLGAIGENARANFVSQVAAGLSSFAASFSAKNKAPVVSNTASKEEDPKTERYNSLVDTVLGKDNVCTEAATRHNSLKPSVETDKLGANAVVGAHAKNGAASNTRRSYFGALLSTLVRGDSSEQASLVGRATSSESLTNEDISLSKKPSGISGWLPWRPFGNNVVVPVE